MKITVLTVGKIKEKSLKSLIDEYVKRLGRYAKTEMIELADLPVPDNPSDAEIQMVIEKEGECVIMCSCDLVNISWGLVEEIRERLIEMGVDFDVNKVIVSAIFA